MEQWEVVAVDKNSVMRFKNEGKKIAGVRLLLKGAEPAGGEKDRFPNLVIFTKNSRTEAAELRCSIAGSGLMSTYDRCGDCAN